MFRKAILATVSAGLLAGSMATTVTPAAAATSIYLGMPGTGFAMTMPRLTPPMPLVTPPLTPMPLVAPPVTRLTPPKTGWVCSPEYRWVPYWSFGELKYRLVKVDEDCHWEWPLIPYQPLWPFGW